MADKSSRNVTYLLGAGASAKALPTVNKMMEGVQRLANAFSNTKRQDKVVREIVKEFMWLSKLHEMYYSIDTAAKVLFHRDKSNYDRLKNVASLYFLLEQTEIEDLKSERLFFDTIDNRYFRILAYYLGEDSIPRLPSNLNFITWNYDAQLELAFHHFNNHVYNNESAVELNCVPRAGHYRLLGDDYERANVVHLNGVAGISLNNEGDQNSLRSLFDVIEANTLDELFDELNGLDILGRYSNKHIFKFAWERGLLFQKAFYRAKKVMEETNDRLSSNINSIFFKKPEKAVGIG
ncbi:MAG: hypothetical protein U5L96_05970 [Owenweeksia sp.]|nr:hypothetical protein [Owenweeksia sp.]